MLSYLKAQCQNGNVRLTGGPTEFEGRVEFCVDGNWGQVCATGWGERDAEAVCRQLGFFTVFCELHAHLRYIYNIIIEVTIIELTVYRTIVIDIYGDETVPPVIYNVQCFGGTARLDKCLFQSVENSSSCAGYSGPAGVVCPGQRTI